MQPIEEMIKELRVHDLDNVGCSNMGTLYWNYKNNPTVRNLSILNKFGNVANNTLLQSNEPWLIDLLDNKDKVYAKSLIKELGIEELIGQLIVKFEDQQDKIDRLEDELADAVSESDFFKRLDLTSIISNDKKFIEIDITEEFIELNFTFVRPYTRAVKVRQQNAKHELVLELNSGVELTEEINIQAMFKRPFQSEVKMSAYVYQHLLCLRDVFFSLVKNHHHALEPHNKLAPDFIDAVLNNDIVIEGRHTFELCRYLGVLFEVDSSEFLSCVNEVDKSQYIQVVVDNKIEVNLIDFRNSLSIYSADIGPGVIGELSVFNMALYQAVQTLSRTQIYERT